MDYSLDISRPDAVDAPIESVRGSVGVAADVVLDCGELVIERRAMAAGDALAAPDCERHGHRRAIGIVVCVEGALTFSHEGKKAVLGVGDFVTLAWGVGGKFKLAAAEKSVILFIKGDYAKFALDVPNLEILLCASFTGDAGMARVFSRFCIDLAKSISDDLPEGVAMSLGNCVAQTYFTLCYEHSKSSITEAPNITALRNKIRQHVEDNLRDPDISVTHIAKEFRISPRYIHMIFSKSGETIKKYIVRRRLEECRRELSDRSLSVRTVTQIAFDGGFSSTTYFSRVFRETYGETPSGFRKKAFASA